MRLVEARTVLFTIELSDTVASVVVLTKGVLLLDFVKDRLVVPVSSGLGVGSTIIKFALQNVDCTRNDGRVCQKRRPQYRGRGTSRELSMYLRRRHLQQCRKPWLQRQKAL